MKEVYVQPETEIIRFVTEDVITESGDNSDIDQGGGEF